MKARTITLLAGLLVAASTQSFAYVKLDNSDPTVSRLIISGEITKDDGESAARQTASIKNKRSIYVHLDSIGGSVDAAIKIGRIIRDNEATVFVAEGAQCLSSCALIYIAGVLRENHGVIGLHRPYLGAALNREEVERAVPLMLQKVKDYVREMGISDAFYDAMVNTEVSEARLFRGDEIKRLVPETDPAHEEIIISEMAQMYGLSAAEYRRREAMAERQCPPSDVVSHSVAEVLTSISSDLTTGNYQQHRLAIQSQGQPIAVAQAQFSVATTGINAE